MLDVVFVCVLGLVTAQQSAMGDIVCPTVCLCDPGAPPVCPHQLIEETDVGRERFAQGLKEFDDNGQAIRMLGDDSFSGWNSSSLLYVNMSGLNIVNISEGALMSLVHIWYLNLSANKISTVHPDTFRHNSALWWLVLSSNDITDISPSTFQYQTKLHHLDLSENKITSLKPDTFNDNRNLLWLSLANNMITVIHPSTFQQQDRLDHLDISGNRLHSIKPDTFNFNRRLIWLSLARNNITDIDKSTFQNQRALHNLDMSDNNLTTIHPDTFQYNWYLQWLSVANNRITDIDQRTFRNQTELRHLDMTQNNITSGTLYYNAKLTWLSLAKNNINNIQPLAFANQSMLHHLDISGNGISGVDSSTFSMHHQLQTLILSDNKLEHIDSKYFSACRNLQNLFLAGNNISVVDSKTFHELKQLHQLDLSNNNIKELELLVCYNCSADRPDHQYRVSTPKYVNLSRNTIQSFHLLQYLPSNCTIDPSDLRFELEFLDLSSNNLDSFNTMTVMWLKLPKVIADLTGNPWKCECSALGEAWRELRHKLTVKCASPEYRRGRTWDVMEEDLCHGNIPDTNSTTANNATADYRQNGSPSLMTTILIVIGVLSGCVLIAGGIILVVLVKKLRDSSNSIQNSNVYNPETSYLQVPSESLRDLSSNKDCAKENIYETLT